MKPEQMDLSIDLTPPAQRHSPTSIAAAEEIEPAAGTLRKKVLTYLRSVGETGATDEQVQIVLHMNPSTERPRRIELVKCGLVIDTGKTRQTISGRSAAIWKAA